MNALRDSVERRLSAYRRSLAPRRIRARFDGPIVFANSVPKSGTNLLTHCLSQFPMLRPSFKHVSMNSNRRTGVDEFERKVSATKPGQYTSGHSFHSDERASILEDNDVRSVLIVRDPRDVVTSHFHYVTEKNTTHRLTDHYLSLDSDDERLLASIRGVDGEYTRDGDPLESIGEWMDRFLKWRDTEYTLVVRFEDLIGPKGGGDRDRQRETVRSIADHLDVEMTSETVDDVSRNTFSADSKTFRKGLIGDWQNHFTEDHVEAFKEEAGDWLVELGYESDCAWDVDSSEPTELESLSHLEVTR